ncbi:hypothetical protein [Flavobacterium urocaniciphilum]|uniref:Uncharacterized protein n=1 Tax=Flavobacterium urocaniciphilum TaxID=1299341 RepID=A0A1H8ZAD3_9FLAO|nr:hypothetical protein [Flavobacterium urocaniciphilum]SEP61217.1 hypothetical protein SAMN05444005_101580 [Flavobacterium urocaniciphilum]
MRKSIQIIFIVLCSVISYWSYGNEKQLITKTEYYSHQDNSDTKELHTVDSPTLLSDNLSRNYSITFSFAKTKIAKSFFGIQILKPISKKSENKSVLAKNHYTYNLISIGFSPTDIIFPFHYFW